MTKRHIRYLYPLLRWTIARGNEDSFKPDEPSSPNQYITPEPAIYINKILATNAPYAGFY